MSGETEPSDEDGADGDLYLNLTNDDVYKKTEGSWVKIGNIKGEKGEKGADATNYYANTFLPAEGGYLNSDKGCYALNETITLSAKAETGYSLEAIEATYNGVTSVYAVTTGLDTLLAEGIVAKEGGYVFRPVFLKSDQKFAVSDLTKIGENGNGTYSLNESAYGSVEAGVTFSSSGEIVKMEGETDGNGKPATTIYVAGKSVLSSRYLFLKNVNIVLADNYVDSSSVLEFNNDFASFENCAIAINKNVECALCFKGSSFGIKDVAIVSEKENDKAFLKTSVLFGEKNATPFSRVVIDNFSVNQVKKAQKGVYAGSVFKSYLDTPYFYFAIKNSTFGTADTPIGELWAHYRQKDYISTRFGQDANLYKKYQKSASVKIENTAIYCDLVNDYPDSYPLNFALITFHVNETEDDDITYKRCFADILLQFDSLAINGAPIDAKKVSYGVDGNFPLVTLYQYYGEDSLWYGCDRINTFQSIYPYANIDGTEVKLASGQYPF